MIISSVARVNFIKSKVIFRYHTKGVSNQASPNSVREIKSYSFSNSSTKMVSGTKFSGLQNGAIRGLQIGARGIKNRGSFRDFKSGQKDYKSGQRDFKSGQRLQIGARGISNWGRDYKSVQNK